VSWFNKYVVGAISPKWAMQRERYARGLKAYYEAAEPSRLHKWRSDRRSANAQNERAAMPIRSQARHLDENHDIASGILDVLVARTVGAGIQPEPQVMLEDGKPADDVNRQLLDLFEDWRFRPEVTWQHDYYSLQRLCARSWFRDGEVFAQLVIGAAPGLDHGTIVPFSLEALEADFVPFDHNEPSKGIIQGIEVTQWGRPKAYHVYKQHPGDNGLALSTERKVITSERMLHLAFRKRLHQLRGVSVFANVLNRLDDVKEIDEAERVAARVAASMAAAIVKGQGQDYEAPEELDSNGKPIPREMEFQAGLIFDDLQPGESITTIDTKRPNNALIPFRDSQLRAAASGTGASFSSISKNYNGTYSAQRQELVEQNEIYQMLAGPVVYRFCQPVWDAFVDAALASGALKLPAGVNKRSMYDCTHTGPSMPWIDPVKEIEAQVTAMKWAITSRSKVIRARGDNPDQVNREIVRDKAELERLDIVPIGDGQAAKPASPTPPDDEPNKPPGNPPDQE
jgi:lambda family phage portal protein